LVVNTSIYNLCKNRLLSDFYGSLMLIYIFKLPEKIMEFESSYYLLIKKELSQLLNYNTYFYKGLELQSNFELYKIKATINYQLITQKIIEPTLLYKILKHYEYPFM